MQRKTSYLTSNKYVLLFGILLLYIAFYLVLKPVYPGSDDYCYLLHAQELISGHFHLTTNELQNRFGLIAPTGFILKLLSTNPYTISLFPLVCGLLTVVAVFLTVNKYADTITATVASLLIATNVLQISYSISLFPDVVISLFMTLIILSVFKGRNTPGFFYPIVLALLFALSFLTKETFVFLFPFLFLLFITDIIKKQNTEFWLKTILCSIIAGLGILLLYFILTGDPFFRFRSATGFIVNDMAYPQLVEVMTKRFHNNALFWFINCTGLVFLFLFALPVLFIMRRSGPNNFKQYVAIYSVILFTEYVVSIFIPQYGLVFYQDRIWLPLVPPLAILAAYFIKEQNKKEGFILFTLLLALTVLTMFIADWHRVILWGIFLTATISSFTKLTAKWKWIVLLAPFMLLLAYFLFTNTHYRI